MFCNLCKLLTIWWSSCGLVRRGGGLVGDIMCVDVVASPYVCMHLLHVLWFFPQTSEIDCVMMKKRLVQGVAQPDAPRRLGWASVSPGPQTKIGGCKTDGWMEHFIKKMLRTCHQHVTASSGVCQSFRRAFISILQSHAALMTKDGPFWINRETPTAWQSHRLTFVLLGNTVIGCALLNNKKKHFPISCRFTAYTMGRLSTLVAKVWSI